MCCYEKVKDEISLFRDIVDLLQVLSMFLCFFDSFLLSVGIGYVGSIGERICFCLRFGTDKSDAVIDGGRGIQEARREWAVELVGVGLR